MQRRTLFATAIALVIGLAASYLLRRQQGREATQMAAGESARAVADASGGAVVALAVGTAVIEGEVQFTGAAPTAGKLHRYSGENVCLGLARRKWNGRRRDRATRDGVARGTLASAD